MSLHRNITAILVRPALLLMAALGMGWNAHAQLRPVASSWEDGQLRPVAAAEQQTAAERWRPVAASFLRPVAVQTGGAWTTSIGHRSSYLSSEAGAFSVQVDFGRSGLGGDGSARKAVAGRTGKAAGRTGKAAGSASSFAAAYGYPAFGVGFSWYDQSAAELRGGQHFGDLWALYGTMRRELVQLWRLSFGYDMALGGCYTSRIFDSENRWNWFYGSHFMIYAAGGVHLSAGITDRLTMTAEAKAIHASNSRLAYPNLGFNTGSVGVCARYAFGGGCSACAAGSAGFVGAASGGASDGAARRSWRVSPELYERGWTFALLAGGGVHTCGTEWYGHLLQTGEYEPPRRWPRAALSAEALYRWAGRFSTGATLDGFWCPRASELRPYDVAIYGEERVAQAPGYEPLSLGLGIVNNVHYGDFAFSHTVGAYLHRNMGVREDHGRLYQQAGFRWYAPQSPIFLSATCKAQLFKAEYLQLGVGVRFRSGVVRSR